MLKIWTGRTFCAGGKRTRRELDSHLPVNIYAFAVHFFWRGGVADKLLSRLSADLLLKLQVVADARQLFLCGLIFKRQPNFLQHPEERLADFFFFIFFLCARVGDMTIYEHVEMINTVLLWTVCIRKSSLKKNAGFGIINKNRHLVRQRTKPVAKKSYMCQKGHRHPFHLSYIHQHCLTAPNSHFWRINTDSPVTQLCSRCQIRHFPRLHRRFNEKNLQTELAILKSISFGDVQMHF